MGAITSAVLISSLVLALISLAKAAPLPSPSPRPYSVPSSRFYLSNVTERAAYFTFDKPVDPSLFGKVRDVVARPEELIPSVHPRVVMGKSEWQSLLIRHANLSTFNTPNSWSAAILRLTRTNGPDSVFLNTLAKLEQQGEAAHFTMRSRSDFSSESEYETYRRSLKPLADKLNLMSEVSSHSLFLCAFWAQVSERQGADAFLPSNTTQKCIDASVAWAKVLMAHRSYHCNPKCTSKTKDSAKSYLWNFDIIWEVSNDWYTAGSTLALAYDVMYNRMTVTEREVIRSALALLIMKRWTWGVVDKNTQKYPNAETHPHRIVSNWGMYHSNLYLTNLAIEGESGFVPYAQQLLTENNSTGFDAKMKRKFEAVINAYMTHSVYPDGSTFEDGYTYHIAFREGALGFLAAHRRGHNLLDTPRFRNTIHNAAQMFEPWQCAPLVGHSSGGGLGYPSFVGLFRYTYPDGALPRMVWAQRFGKNFTNDKNCRTSWTQTMTQMVLLGDEHKEDKELVADAPESLAAIHKKSFPLTYVSARRGLIISRSSYSQNSSYMHLDARPDSFYVGHDNADRGVITFSALKTRWLDDLEWKENVDSRKHSLMHVDGLAQAVKAPSVTILKAVDNESSAIASADLTYAYNVQWAIAWQGPSIGRGDVKEYNNDNSFTTKTYTFVDAEVCSPWDLGWPMEDDAAEIGFKRNMTMNGHADLAAFGMNEWRRHYREQDLKHMVRSIVMGRSDKNEVGYSVLVDSVNAGEGKHTFESYLILNDEVTVDEKISSCTTNQCTIVLRSGDEKRVDVHAQGLGDALEYRLEKFDKHTRLVVKSVREQSEEMWIALHPYVEDGGDFSMVRSGDAMVISYENDHKVFQIGKTDHSVEELDSLQ